MNNTNTYDIFALSESSNKSAASPENTRIIDLGRTKKSASASAQAHNIQNSPHRQKKSEPKGKRKNLFSSKGNTTKKTKVRQTGDKRVQKKIGNPILQNHSEKSPNHFTQSREPYQNNMRNAASSVHAGTFNRIHTQIPTQNTAWNQNYRGTNISNYYGRTATDNFNNPNFLPNQQPNYGAPQNAFDDRDTLHQSNTHKKLQNKKGKKKQKQQKNIKKSRSKFNSDIVYENLRQQNPRVRRARRFQRSYLNNKGIPTSDAVKAQRYRIKVKRKAVFSLFLGRFTIFLAFYMLLAVISCGIFYINLKRHPEADTEPYLLVINGQTDDEESYELKMEDFYINGGLYLDMSLLANVFDLTTTGNVENLRYVNTLNGNELRVTVGSSVITMNTVSVPLGRPVTRRNDSVLIPIEFFENYVEGITLQIGKDEKTGTKKIYLDQVIEGYTSSVLYGNKAVYESISFALKDPSAANNIPENSLPTDILYETDPLRLAEEAIKAAEEARKAEEAAAAAAANNSAEG